MSGEDFWEKIKIGYSKNNPNRSGENFGKNIIRIGCNKNNSNWSGKDFCKNNVANIVWSGLVKVLVNSQSELDIVKIIQIGLVKILGKT